MLGSIYEHEFENKKYNFVVTRKARLAIEEMQRSIFDDMGDASAFTVMMDMNSIEVELKELNKAKEKAEDDEAESIDFKIDELKEKLKKIQMEMIPNMKEFAKMEEKAQDEYEIAKILLMNSEHTNGVVSAELAEKILDKMEFDLGDEAFIEKTLEIYDKVFTQIATIRDRKQAIDKKNQLQNEKALPMS